VIDEEGETIARNAYVHSRAASPALRSLADAPQTTLAAQLIPAASPSATPAALSP